MRQRLRRLRGHLSLAITLAVFAIWTALLRPQSLAGDAGYIVIRGDSMEPSYRNGDLVIVRSAHEYAIGDAIAYRVPDGDTGAGTVVIHRIVGGNGVTGFVLQGDNNERPDPWFPVQSDVVGKEALRLPWFGLLMAFLHQPVALGALGAGIAVMWVIGRPAAPSRRRMTESTGAADYPALEAEIVEPTPGEALERRAS